MKFQNKKQVYQNEIKISNFLSKLKLNKIKMKKLRILIQNFIKIVEILDLFKIPKILRLHKTCLEFNLSKNLSIYI